MIKITAECYPFKFYDILKIRALKFLKVTHWKKGIFEKNFLFKCEFFQDIYSLQNGSSLK